MIRAYCLYCLLFTLCHTGSIHAATINNPLTVPAGFKIEAFASVPNPRQMALTQAGHIVVGTRRHGSVFGLKQTSKGHYASPITIVDNLNMPAGVAIHSDGNLYIAATHQILSISNIDQAFAQNHFKPTVITDRLPNYNHHGWKHIGFAPNGQLVIPFGVPCNLCLSDNPIIGSIQALNLKTLRFTALATGVRNSVGVDFHPKTGQLWFSDNGRDWMGDDLPADEINHVTEYGQHFGFPFLHGRDTQEPDTKIQAAKPKNLTMKGPSVEIQAHSAPLGIHFYTGKQFPAEYRHGLFVALHGSWNRSVPVGYKIMVYWFDEHAKVSRSQTLVDGFLLKQGNQAGQAFGRPVDFLQMPDGSLLISDDLGNKLWRLSYAKPITQSLNDS